ncbi:MAG: ATP-binding protein, partial [Anaerolineales bacterium]
ASLQAVGQSLSTSLDIEDILEGIYREISKLMAADNFYVALYNPETEEVSFPLAYEHNRKVEWQIRDKGKGLTEYVLETKEPLLIEKNVKETVESLGMVHYGQEAISWLGVPILAGDEPLGMIAVQSYPLASQIPKPLDSSHKQILTTIAAQASITIQNARLYAKTDQALSQRILELDSILSTTSEGLALLDKEMTILEVNRALCQMLNQSPSYLIGRSSREEDTTPHPALRIQNSIFQALGKGPSETYKEKIALAGKPEIPVERTISPVRDEDGEINGWLLVFRDLTEEYRLVSFREDLTRMLVHDLRSPIVTIQGGLDMIEVLLEDEDYETIPEMVNIAQNGCVKMLGMINELLNINQLESGELTLQYRPVDIAATLRELTTQFSSMTKLANLNLTLNISKDLTPIQGDPDLLKRVFHNLLDNAIKFTPDNNPIEVWAKMEPEDPKNILVGVKDSGPGIPEKMQQELFKKHFSFQQEKSRRRGTGLGLYFCNLAVGAHNGEIEVKSKLGEGSTFIVRLPAEPVHGG